MNPDDKKEKAEEIFFNNLFEKKEKEQNEQLYKNEFYVLEEEMKSNKEQNSLQFMHDALLNKLMLEDYSPFPPKNEEPTIVNNQKEEKKKEDEQDRLIEEENEFLRSLHRINYLTFSPFGLSFFDDNYKDNQNANEEYLKEREEKILQMINFDYNDFEVTNDLLLNICQGFVDINKLKEENLTSNKNKEESILITGNIHSNIPETHLSNKKLINSVGPLNIKEQSQLLEKDNEEILDEELYEIVEKKRKIDFYKDIIKQFDEEVMNVDKNDKKTFIKKWKDLLKQKDKEYDEYIKKIKEEERKKKLEEKRLREIKRRKEKEKEEQIKSQNMLKKGLEQIVQKAKKIGMISNSNSPKKSKRRKKMLESASVKKSLNNSMITNRTNNSFISKSLIKNPSSTKRKKRERSINKKSAKK